MGTVRDANAIQSSCRTKLVRRQGLDVISLVARDSNAPTELRLSFRLALTQHRLAVVKSPLLPCYSRLRLAKIPLPDWQHRKPTICCDRPPDTSRVHSNLGHDAHPNLSVLPAIERENRALVQIAQGRVHPAGNPLSLDNARRLVQGYVNHYNKVRLNSATGYITPKDMLAGRQQEIHAERDRKLEAARTQRQIRRQQAA